MKNSKPKLLGVLMVLFLLLSGCGKSNALVGSWSDASSGYELIYTFENDGTSAVSVCYTYSVDGDALTIAEADIFNYKIDDQTLTLSSDGVEFLAMTRTAENNGAGNDIIGAWEYEESGVKVICTFGNNGEYSMAFPGTYAVGGNTLTIIMGSEEEAYTYKVNGKTLTLSAEDIEDIVLTKK